jgi:hypothetical protein
VQLNNEHRIYDPSYTASPVYPNVVPGKRVTIATNGVPIADGQVEDWNLEYEPSGRSIAYAECVDALGALALAEFDEWTSTAGQTAGPRLAAILDRPEVGFTANRALDTGVSVLQGDEVSWGSNVLNYAQLVTNSDLGRLFASRDGVLTFKDRHAELNDGTVVDFADDGTGVGYSAIEVTYGTELLYNRVGIERQGGTDQTVTDATSVAAYRARSFTQRGLLQNSDAQTLDMANYLLGIYKTPELRVSSLTVQLHGLDDADQAAVVGLDIANVISVTFTPNRLGDAVQRTCIIEGIRHDIGPDYHEVTLSLGDTDRRSFLTLDDSIFGALNGANVLAF